MNQSGVRRWTAEPLGEGRFQLGEGPHWEAVRARLSWVDITEGTLWVDDGAGIQSFSFGDPLGVAVPHAEGGWVCGLGRGLALVAEDGAVLQHLELEPDGVRMNDGKCDPLGRFFVGSKAHDNHPGAGNLWRLDLDGTIERMLSGLTIANGLGWSPDGSTMYVTDSALGRIDAFDYDLSTGRLGAHRSFLELPSQDGAPDGLAVDVDGGVWTALWGGSQVRRYSPTGKLTDVVEVSATQPTSCAFVGPGLTTLVITTAWDELDEWERAGQPDAGRHYRAEVGLPGRAGDPCRAARSGWVLSEG